MKKKVIVYITYICFILFIISIISLIFAVAVDLVTEKKFTDKNAIIEDKNNLIQSYVKKLKEKCPECKDCGVNEYENGYIIDGYYYEFKGEANIEMEEE